MYALLAVFAAVFALVVTGFGAFAAWAIWSVRSREVRTALSQWTVFDYLLLALFVIGTLFLLADVIGMMRDRGQFPYFHYGYLLSGFVYNTLAGILLFVRLGLTIRLLGTRESDRAPAVNDEHAEPDEA